MAEDEVNDAAGPAAPSQAPSVPGYRIEGLLGRGSTGVVYRARQLSVDREVALKILHRELVGARKAELRLQREARATAKLAHPNIVTAIDMGEVDGVWWYAMELVDGQPLHRILAERRLSEREALRLFIPIVEALQHLFERGVVHRDIKPSNILVDAAGRARLVDLGLACADDDPQITNHGGTLGTPHYISPEQARDPGSADVQSDLWSLGATLYHAVCGRPPFAGASTAEILSAVLHEKVRDPVELAGDLSGGFVLVLRKCLVRDRARRYATPAALLADLERVRERRAPKVARRGLEPLRRDPRRLFATAALTAGLAGAVALLAVGITRGGLGGPAGAAPAAQPHEELLAQVEAALNAPLPELVTALARSEPLARAGTLSEDEARRLARARALVSDRLDSELWKVVREFDLELEAALKERRYDDAAALVADEWPARLRLRTGGERLLPDETERQLAARAARWSVRAREARSAAREAWKTALAAHWRQSLAPRVDAELSRGDWASAARLLAELAGGWAAAVPGSQAGLSRRELEEAQAAVVADEVEPRRAALLAQWTRLDAAFADELRAEARRAEQRLRVGEGEQALAELREWRLARMAQLPLVEGEEPPGLPHLALEAWTSEAERLAALARSLPASGSEREWTRLVRACAERAGGERREWLAAAELAQARRGEAWPAALAARLDLLEREYRLLHEVLLRAAAGLRAKEGAELELATRGLRLRGTLHLGGDPLAKPFALQLSGGAAPYALALRTIDAEAAPVVDADMLAALAGLDAARPEDALLLLVLRMEEQDLRAVRTALAAPALDRDDPLALLAEQRIEDSVDGARAAALERLRNVRREARLPEDLARFVWRIDDLLAECDQVLTEDEKRELRELRGSGAKAEEPARPADVSAFGADDVQLLPGGRVALAWKLGERAAGRLDPGGWRMEKEGWSVVRALRDEELPGFGGPALPLAAPLDPRAPLSVRCSCAVDASEPPDLWLLSVLGVHAVVVVDRNGKSARVLLDAADEKELPALLRRARAGEGRLVQLSGDTLEASLVLARKGDVVRLEIDGRAVFDRQLRPSAAAADQRVQLRSSRPARFRALAVEAGTR